MAKRMIRSGNDLVRFVIFKRKLKQQIKSFFIVFITLLIFLLISLIIANKRYIYNCFSQINNKIILVCDYIFSSRIENIQVKMDKNTLLDRKLITKIIDENTNGAMRKQQMENLIIELKKTNPIIENIIIRKSLSTKELTINIKEKKIIAVLLSEECFNNNSSCKKKLLAENKDILPYSNSINTKQVLTIYGNILDYNIINLKNKLTQKAIINEIKAIHFYSNGRFDIILNNGTIIKLPKNNWEHGIERFIKLNNNYGNLLTNSNGIQYIDLRQQDKIYIKNS